MRHHFRILSSLLCAGCLLPIFGAASAQRHPTSKQIQKPLWWSFKKPILPVVPTVRNSSWVRNPIDAFILAKLEQKGLRPAPYASRQTLIRRVYFDLIGLPPSPERVERFVKDANPKAYENLIDELLASPQYGERWARHWLDVARYADTGGYETDIYYKNAWRYRDYVIKSFNDDKPYDRFVQEQIAGDELWPDDLTLTGSYVLPPSKLKAMEAHIGTGLYTFYPQIHESNMDGKKIGHERLTDWVDTTASVFMGVTLGCARCHNHKFDPFTQRDYYRMQALFAASREVEIPLVHAMAIASNKQHYPTLIAVDEARRAYRIFDQKVQKRGGKLSPEDEAEKRLLLERISSSVLAIPETIPDAPGGSWEGLMEIPSATVLGHYDPSFAPSIQLLRRGELTMPLEKMSPGLPAVLRDATAWKESFHSAYGNRKELALWLTRPKHPLTARVIVNRAWQWHFGRGIVATPNDFGKMGQAPTYPDLLDWLASNFVARSNGVMEHWSNATGPSTTPPLHHSNTLFGCSWSLKKLHRLILLSSTYQMDSRSSDEGGMRIDPDNALLWRMNRRRLEGEAIWDSLHAVAGNLNPKMGGRPVIPPLTDEELASLRERSQWTVSADPDEHRRRGIYILTRRNFRFPLFEAFDAPVNAVSCPRRDVTTVAPQSLWFLNNRVSFARAAEFAARLASESTLSKNNASLFKTEADENAFWIERAWNLALSRSPTDAERWESLQLLSKLQAGMAAKPIENMPAALARLDPVRAAALTKFCLTMFNLNEFLFVD